jgi:hypothetical protein
MARVATKGTLFQVTISAALTTVAGVFRLKGPGVEVKTWNATDLSSGVGEEKKVTGHVEGKNVSGSLWMDPVAATFQFLTDLLTAPASNAMNIDFADAATTSWPFTGIVKNVEPSVELNAGLMAEFEVELDGIPTYPT